MPLSLLLAVLLSAIALFFASFLSWMVIQFHKGDWRKLPEEDVFLAALQPLNLPPGNYAFPNCESPKDQQSPEFQAKWEIGPRGVVTFFPVSGMGAKLAQTFVYFLIASFCLACLAISAVPYGASTRAFWFTSTAAFLTFFAAIVPHAIWFKVRIVGHLIESIAYAAIVGAIFGAMWPAAA